MNEQEIAEILSGSLKGRKNLSPDDPDVKSWFVPNPDGYCLCGCGQKTKIARQTDKGRGWLVGQPKLWLQGHHNSGVGGRAPVEEGKKWCPYCKQNLPYDRFTKRSDRGVGLAPYCKDCVYKAKFETTYGIPYEEYEKLLEQQEGKCAICKREEKLVVDHDHDTGQVRGLLCNRCNICIHIVDVGLLEPVLSYLGFKYNTNGIEPLA